MAEYEPLTDAWMLDDLNYRKAMSGASINDLQDSAFAVIEPGGTKDPEGKTVPRSLRHYPVHDEAHAKNAYARASAQIQNDGAGKEIAQKAMPKIKAALKKFGFGGDGDAGYNADDGTQTGGGSVNPAGVDDGARAKPRWSNAHRRARQGTELRVVGETLGGVEVSGLVIPYNRRACIKDGYGKFGETISRGAASHIPGHDVRLLYAHANDGMVFARTQNKTLKLTETPAGLRFIATLDVNNSQAAADLAAAIDRRDVSGMSWAFDVGTDGERWNASMTERTIVRFSRVPEISVVAFPAYGDDTSVSTTVREAVLAERRRIQARGERIQILHRRLREVR